MLDSYKCVWGPQHEMQRVVADDVRISDLEPLLQYVERVKAEIDEYEHGAGICLSNPHRQFFATYCEDCARHVQRLREELRALYRQLHSLALEANQLKREAVRLPMCHRSRM